MNWLCQNHVTTSLGPAFQVTRDPQQLGNLWYMYTVGSFLLILFLRWSLFIVSLGLLGE